MRRRKDKELDLNSLNQILNTGKKLINIGYVMAIICLIILGTYLIKEWKLLKYIGEFLVVISPIFIGFLIAWFFDPLVRWLQERRVPRALGCIFVYLIIIGFLMLISYLFIPQLISQVKDFVSAAPYIFEEVTDFVLNIIKTFDSNNFVKIQDRKSVV